MPILVKNFFQDMQSLNTIDERYREMMDLLGNLYFEGPIEGAPKLNYMSLKENYVVSAAMTICDALKKNMVSAVPTLMDYFDNILLNLNTKSMQFNNFWINQTYERAVIFGCVYYILSMDSDYPESSLKKIGSLIHDERDKAYFNVFKNAADKARDLKETEIVQGADVVQQNVEASDGKRIILADKRYSDFTRIVQAMIQDAYFTHADKSAVTATEVGEMMLKLLGVSTSWKSMLQKAFSRDNPMKTFDNLRDAAQSYWQKRANI